MENKYDVLRNIYDKLVKDVVPELTVSTVDEAVGAVNTLVSLQRPQDWRVSNEPRAILGITSDKSRVVYGDVARFGFYYAVPVDELHQRISGMVDEARKDYEEGKSVEGFDVNANYAVRMSRQRRLRRAEALLEEVVALRN